MIEDRLSCACEKSGCRESVYASRSHPDGYIIIVVGPEESGDKFMHSNKARACVLSKAQVENLIAQIREAQDGHR